MAKNRVTIETLRSGQPRPYADTEHVVRVTFEWNGWRDANAPFQPQFVNEDHAKDRLYGLQCGFLSTPRSEAGFMESYLDYLRPVDRQENGSASVWEFRTVSPYTG